jgi:hypothetical protein
LFELSLVLEVCDPGCRRGGKGVSGTGVEGSRARRHHVSWQGMWNGGNGGSGGGGRGTSGGVSGSVLAGAAGAARNCRCGLGCLRYTSWGRSRGSGDGGVNEGEAFDDVLGTWLTALWFLTVHVEILKQNFQTQKW